MKQCVKWIKISKKVLSYDIVVDNTYVPPTGTDYLIGDELDIILDYVISINADH